VFMTIFDGRRVFPAEPIYLRDPSGLRIRK
jgi:hypothetical protein